ncbi:MAG: hypothetical protein HYX89_08280, partial [Chloroflexi bacterium]|nr:hypothetical protein [Chloroflexota bacterium]
MDNPSGKRHFGWFSRFPRWRAITTLAVVSAMALMLAGVVAVYGSHTLNLFELEGNVANDVVAGDDWANIWSGANSAKAKVFVQDDNPDGTDLAQEINFGTGGAKDDLNISMWTWDTSPVPDKNDIMNAGAALYTYTGVEKCPPGVLAGDPLCTKNGDPIMYFFLDRFSSGTGDADVGFWFFKGIHGLVPSAKDPTKGTFFGTHDVGDVLVLSEFTIGGGVSTVKIFSWVGGALGDELHLTTEPGFSPSGPLQLKGRGVDCDTSPINDIGCATVNKPPTAPYGDPLESPPWPYTDKQGTTDYGPAALFEGGINIRAVGLDVGCGGTFLAETRASQSTDARLHDFAIKDFSLCDLAVVKDGDTLSKIGDDVNYTITITNTGATTLYKQTITDTLLGNITLAGVDQVNALITSNTCAASLLAGASCTILATRTVLAGDPDPLPNTVRVVYNSSASPFTGTAVTRSDPHSVNLFQPAIDVTKTADELSKIGDDVNYVITVSNNS